MSKANAILSRSENPEGKESLDASFAEAEVFRAKAVKHLKTKWQRIHSKQIDDRSYDSPSWSERQAACNGSLLMIEEVLREVFNEKVN